MKINNKGYWENETEEGHGVDKGLAETLRQFFWSMALGSPYLPLRVIDIGCGTGYYSRIISSELVEVTGYDGNPNTPVIAGREFRVADFSIPQYLGEYDWTLSLEVGEHIPPEYEDVFIDNLHRHNKYGMTISWSIPEYGGDGHVNSRPNEYIIEKITKLGYEYEPLLTSLLRATPALYPEPCYWFRKTLMVFTRG